MAGHRRSNREWEGQILALGVIRMTAKDLRHHVLVTGEASVQAFKLTLAVHHASIPRNSVECLLGESTSVHVESGIVELLGDLRVPIVVTVRRHQTWVAAVEFVGVDRV